MKKIVTLLLISIPLLATAQAKSNVSPYAKGAVNTENGMVVFEKSIERATRRGGVPVFRRVSLNPSRMRDSLRRSTAGRPSPPDGVDSLPMKIRPRSEVPVVRTTLCAPMNP